MIIKSFEINKIDFDQNKLNEIVLWKVNRYAKFDDRLIDLINSIDRNNLEINEDKTRLVLRELLKTKNGKSIQMNQFSVRVTQTFESSNFLKNFVDDLKFFLLLSKNLRIL